MIQKQHLIVALPTKDYSNVVKHKVNGNIILLPGHIKENPAYQPHHLYLLSDEEILDLGRQAKRMGGTEIRGISLVVNDLERFIKREANLFIDDTEEKADDEEEINDTDTDNKIDLWMEEFETNFPGLEIRDSHQFDPNI